MGISVTKAAHQTGLTRAGIIKAIRQGHLKATREGAYYRIAESDLAQFSTNRPRRGRPVQIPIDAKERLFVVAQTPPQTLGLEKWTLKLLQDQLRAEGVEVSAGYITGVLHEAGIRNSVLTSPRGRRKVVS